MRKILLPLLALLPLAAQADYWTDQQALDLQRQQNNLLEQQLRDAQSRDAHERNRQFWQDQADRGREIDQEWAERRQQTPRWLQQYLLLRRARQQP